MTMDQIKKELQRFLTRFSLDPYLTLGVARTVEVSVAKKAYRKLILKSVQLPRPACPASCARARACGRLTCVPGVASHGLQVSPGQEPTHDVYLPSGAAGV